MFIKHWPLEIGMNGHLCFILFFSFLLTTLLKKTKNDTQNALTFHR